MWKEIGYLPLYSYPCNTMNKNQFNIGKNSVKGSRFRSDNGSSLGKQSCAQQVAVDCHPVTAQKYKDPLNIATWKVRTLYAAGQFENSSIFGQFENVKQEMLRLTIDILCISEVRWKGNRKFTSDKVTIYYSGNENVHQYGVGFMINKKTEKAVISCWKISDNCC